MKEPSDLVLARIVRLLEAAKIDADAGGDRLIQLADLIDLALREVRGWQK